MESTMKKCFYLMIFFLSFSLLADVSIGTYQGNLPNGEECSIEVKRKHFLNNFRHPLNERIEIYFELENKNFSLAHPPQYLVETQRIFFNHDILAQTIATQTGADGFMLHMAHGPLKRGPQSFQYIKDNWRNPSKKEVYDCQHLNFIDG